MAGLKQLIHEVHRRSLWQVLGIYVVGSWIALQVVDVLGQNFGLPAWFPPFALALLVIGLPIVLATAFVQEGVGKSDPEPEGRSGAAEVMVGLHAEDQRAEPPPHHRWLTWRNAITGGMAAFALWGIVAAGWLLVGPSRNESTPATAALSSGSSTAGAGEDRRSIAVLPFSNRSADAEGDAAFFASGIHDDILTQLSKIDALKVISRTSVMQYEGTQKTIGEIGDELSVATVLEGSVQRAGDRVRVNVQLIDADSDEHLWAETYDEELTAANVFAIQTDVAQQIAGALQARLAPEVAEKLERRPTESLEAYDLYLRGRYLHDKTSKEAYEGAIELYEQAIGADPDFALAYTGLADAYLSLLGRGFVQADDALPRARAAAERGLALDPLLAEAHVSMAGVYTQETQWEKAEEEFRRSLELNPGYARAFATYANLLVSLGRFEEALALYERAAELDPRSRLIRANAVFNRFFVRDFEGTIDGAMNLIELEPSYSYGFYILAAALSFVGRHEEAIDAAMRAIELEPEDLYNLAGLGFVHAQAGNREEALSIAGRVEEQGGSLKEVALIYGALGEIDTAFQYLERAYERDPADLDLLNADPSADPLRDDPRFAEIIERVGLD